ncbi:MAG: hypothetical protein FJ096_11810 [Deltaproteobacteria bacterium]|nr:hypothetical protein [Deltaproteobacteria bacterium]
MDVKERVDVQGIVHFHRGTVLCAMTATAAQLNWGHVGVAGTCPFVGRIFVDASGNRLYKIRLAPTGNPAIDRRWWLGFECSRPYSFEHTMAELKRAADHLHHAERQVPRE